MTEIKGNPHIPNPLPPKRQASGAQSGGLERGNSNRRQPEQNPQKGGGQHRSNASVQVSQNALQSRLAAFENKTGRADQNKTAEAHEGLETLFRGKAPKEREHPSHSGHLPEAQQQKSDSAGSEIKGLAHENTREPSDGDAKQHGKDAQNHNDPNLRLAPPHGSKTTRAVEDTMLGAIENAEHLVPTSHAEKVTAKDSIAAQPKHIGDLTAKVEDVAKLVSNRIDSAMRVGPTVQTGPVTLSIPLDMTTGLAGVQVTLADNTLLVTLVRPSDQAEANIQQAILNLGQILQSRFPTRVIKMSEVAEDKEDDTSISDDVKRVDGATGLSDLFQPRHDKS